MPPFLDLANEILHDILVDVYPEDLAALSRSCHTLNKYIRNNRILWKEVYLKYFDHPSTELVEANWVNELQSFIRLQKILQSRNGKLKRAELIPASQTIVQILNQATPNHSSSRNIGFLTSHLNGCNQNMDIFLFSSSLYEQVGSDNNIPAETEDGRQMSAKIHSLFGVSSEVLGQTHSLSAHSYARSRVYNLRNYAEESNKWGPFKHDGICGVDWEKVEAIMVLLAYNMQLLSERSNSKFPKIWNEPFEGATPNSYTPIEKHAGFETAFSRAESVSTPRIDVQLDPPLEARDPYGVTGMWRRIVCFLDYRDFFSFNFSNLSNPDVEREPIDTQEAIRLIAMKVRVTKLEAPGEDDGQDLPVVHFSGTSRSMHPWDANANSVLEGTVRLTQQGQVRWTTLSIFHGEPRWRSEGIQIGGIRSARGVIGTWFDHTYDREGPIGPTAFWKLADEIEDDGSTQELPDMFQ